MPRAKGRLPKCCHTDGVDGSIALLGTCCVGFTPVVSLPSGEIRESHRVESEVVGLGGRVVTVVTVVSVTGPRNGGGLFDCSAPTPRGFVRFYGHFGPHTSQDWLDFNCGTTQRGGECFSPHFGSLFFGGKSGSMQNPYMQCPQGSSLRCGFLRCGICPRSNTQVITQMFSVGVFRCLLRNTGFSCN